MKKERRWMKSAIAAAADSTVVLPFQRGAKRKPASFKLADLRRAIAAK